MAEEILFSVVKIDPNHQFVQDQSRLMVVGEMEKEQQGWKMLGGDLFSVIVRLRLRAGVCDDETDGERDRWRGCFRVLLVTDEFTISMGSVSSTTQFFSCALVRSYSASG